MNFFQVNLTAALLILAILLFRLLTVSRLPKRIFLFLWAIVFCRLLLPFFITLPAWPIDTGFSTVAQKLDRAGKSILTQATVGYTAGNRASHMLFVIWLVGIGVFFLAFLLLYLFNIKKLSDAMPVKNQVWLDQWLSAQKLRRPLRLLCSDRVASPVCCGIFRPRIILPASLKLENTESLEFMLLHEMVHIRKFDAVWKLLLAVTCCAYWLNPAVWVFGYFFDRDLELSCDERVLRQLQNDKREAYANTLVGMAAAVGGIELATQGFSRTPALKERIISIMRYRRKMPIWAIALCVILTLGTTTAFAAAPKNADFKMPTLPDMVISMRGKPGSVLSAGEDGKLHVIEPGMDTSSQQKSGYPSSASSVPAGTHIPRMESGMRMVYDGGGDLIKITSSDGSIYYFPTDDSTPDQYKGGTWFIWVDYAKSSKGQEEAYNIDTAAGMHGAFKWIESHPGIKDPSGLKQSLNLQRGTQILIYYMGKL